MNFLQMSFSAAVMILPLVLTRALAINQLPKKTFVALWGIILCRLIIPFSLPSRFSVYSLFYFLFSTSEAPTSTTVATLINPPPATMPILGEATVSTLQTGTATFLVWETVWIIGVILCTLFFLTSYIRCRKRFYESFHVESAFISKWLAEHKIMRTIQVRQIDRISTPLTYGVFHPVILLPRKIDLNNEHQLKYILTHEYVHIQHFDAVAKLLFTAALCVHWFNPLVWAMYVLANHDIELFCDETVVRIFGETTKSAYALALIDMEEEKCRITPLCNNFNKNAIEERLIAIMKIKKISVMRTIFSLVLVISMTTAFATSADASSSKTQPIKDYTKEYANTGVSIQDSVYYYHSARIRIFMDMKANNAFENCIIDPEGTVDIRVVRNSKGSIVKIEYIPKDEANEIFDDLDYSNLSDATNEMITTSPKTAASQTIKDKIGPVEDIQRMTKDEIPIDILKALDTCDGNGWYLIDGKDSQYIYYNNLPRNYAFQFQTNENKIMVVDIGKTTGNYLLLSVPKKPNLLIYYNSKSITFTKVEAN